MSDESESALQHDEILRTARTRCDKVIRFYGETEDGSQVTWFVAYRGNFGWTACRATGEWMDDPSDDDVEAAVEHYDDIQLIELADTPKEVTL